MLAALKARAFELKNTPVIGRSHGIHAEPTTFGLKLAGPMPSSPAPRAARAARDEVGRAISGAVGTFAHLDPRVEGYVAPARP